MKHGRKEGSVVAKVMGGEVGEVERVVIKGGGWEVGEGRGEEKTGGGEGDRRRGGGRRRRGSAGKGGEEEDRVAVRRENEEGRGRRE